MIFICSRGRRERLKTFFEVSEPKLPGRVLIDDDDESYAEMELPEGWSFLVGKRDGTVQILNRAFEALPNEPFYSIICDDMVYLTGDWDGILSRECGDRYVSWGDDGRWGEKLCTSFFIGGELVRKIGWLAHPDLGHLYADTVWWMIAKGSGLYKYRPDIKFKHTKLVDRTFVERKIATDHITFEKLRSWEIPQLTLKAASLRE